MHEVSGAAAHTCTLSLPLSLSLSLYMASGLRGCFSTLRHVCARSNVSVQRASYHMQTPQVRRWLSWGGEIILGFHRSTRGRSPPPAGISSGCPTTRAIHCIFEAPLGFKFHSVPAICGVWQQILTKSRLCLEAVRIWNSGPLWSRPGGIGKWWDGGRSRGNASGPKRPCGGVWTPLPRLPDRRPRLSRSGATRAGANACKDPMWTCIEACMPALLTFVSASAMHEVAPPEQVQLQLQAKISSCS